MKPLDLVLIGILLSSSVSQAESDFSWQAGDAIICTSDPGTLPSLNFKLTALEADPEFSLYKMEGEIRDALGVPAVHFDPSRTFRGRSPIWHEGGSGPNDVERGIFIGMNENPPYITYLQAKLIAAPKYPNWAVFYPFREQFLGHFTCRADQPRN